MELFTAKGSKEGVSVLMYKVYERNVDAIEVIVLKLQH